MHPITEKRSVMTNRGLCPKCGKRVLHVNVEHIVGMIDGESKARCLSYCCIHCNTVLGVAIDARSKPRSKNGARSASASAPAKPVVRAG
jgi:hypothetical protein